MNALFDVDWGSALADLRRRATAPDGRRRLAWTASLAARFSAGFEEGAARALEGVRIEPLNPLHRVRFALHCLRFGQHERALDALETLGPAKELPLARTVRALATLQSGEDRRAANIARDLAAAHPSFVSAAFLQADAHLGPQPKEADTRAQSLPRDPAWASAWTHLLVKLIVARPRDAAKVAKQHLDVRPVLAKGSRHEALVRKAAAWCSATEEELGRAAVEAKVGSREEELLVALLVDRLERHGDGDVALRALAALHHANPDRPALRRVYVAALTRVAIAHAAAERFGAALRVIEAAARLEPHEPVHLQNRAALLTAMADDAQHDAWADLDRLHYRLALAGLLDGATSSRIAKPHRMFAEQARLTPGHAGTAGDSGAPRVEWGVFRVVEEKEDGTVTRSLEVNQARLDDDPETLRQWIHHRRAELVFRHIGLGGGPRRILLGATESRAHRARVRALVIAAESLAVLVPEEGRVLKDRLASAFRQLRVGRTYYAAVATNAAKDAGATSLELQYAETVADLAVIAWSWAADPKRPDIVEELLDTIDATVPFLEESALSTLLAPDRAGELSNARFLNAFVRQTLLQGAPKGRGDGDLVLTDALRVRIAGRLASELLLTLARRRLDATPSLSRPEIERALEIVDRARERDPEHARVEFMAARILTIGEFYDEARACVERFGKIAGTDSPFQQGIEEIQRILDEKKKANAPGNARSGSSGARRDEKAKEDDESGGSRASRLEAEIERFPASVQLYEDLAHALCASGAFEPARAWAIRAMGRCLTRKAQLRARILEIEVIALEQLARKHFAAVEVYLAGSHGAALEALDAALADARAVQVGAPNTYALHYLRGTCLLARRNRDGAEQAFRAALDACSQQRSRAALRPLAEDVEQALLDQSHAAVESAIAAGKLREALREVEGTMGATRAPEACLLDLARVQLAVAVAAVAKPADEAELPTPAVDPRGVAWRDRLRTALGEDTALKRARALATLAQDVHPSAKEAAVLLRRVDAFGAELAFADTIAESTRLERRGEVTAAFALLDAAGERAMTDARALRLRVMLLLRLDRFDDADRAVDLLKASGHAGAKTLVEKYPELRFKYGLAAATRLLRANDIDKAHAILVSVRGSTREGELERVYSLAFCVARKAYLLLDAGKRPEAIEKMQAALEMLETHVARDATQGTETHTRVVELRDRLDADLAHMQNPRP